MKKKSVIIAKYTTATLLALLLVVALLSGCQKSESKANQSIILATTTSLNDTELLSYLLPKFTNKTGINVKPIAVGSGEALEMGVKGDADIVLSHSPDKEEELLKKGQAVSRTSFMYNYFAIVGPKNDPAGIAEASSAEEAFKKIAESKQVFVSRGDDSGTEKKELKIWEKAKVDYKGTNYIKTGQGMGETLQVANEKDAYTLTDKATYISFKEKLGELKILLTNNKSLRNTYSLIELNPKKVKFNKESAKKFKEFLLSKITLQRIAKFGTKKYGEPLFMLSRAGSANTP